MIKWNGDSVILKTSNDLEWSFKGPSFSMPKGDYLTSVSSLASALLCATIEQWIEFSEVNCVCFTLVAEDINNVDKQ